MSDKGKENNNNYWKENLRILSILLSIWFVVSFLLSIIFVDELDLIRIGGFKFGFWMAQQGSIYVYVVLIFIYLKFMDRLDEKYHHAESEIRAEESRSTKESDSGSPVNN